jgi:hypothetical protein
MSLTPLLWNPLRVPFPVPLCPLDVGALRCAVGLALVANEKSVAILAKANAVALADQYATNLRLEAILSEV